MRDVGVCYRTTICIGTLMFKWILDRLTNLSHWKFVMLVRVVQLPTKVYMQVLFGYFSIIGHPSLIGLWFNEDQKIKHLKDTCLKEIGQRLQNALTTSTLNNHYEHNWEGLCIQLENQQTFSS